MPETPPALTEEDTLAIARDTLRDALAIVREANARMNAMREEVAEIVRRLDALEARWLR